MPADQTRTYKRDQSIVFLKTKEAFGGLSNMAGGCPLKVNGIRILTSREKLIGAVASSQASLLLER